MIERIERGGFRAYLQPNLTAIERISIEIAKWDLEGRPVSAQLDERFYRRGISHAMMAKGKRERAGRLLGEEEKRAVLGRIRRLADEARAALLRGHNRAVETRDLEERLARIAEWDLSRLEEEEKRFSDVYRPIPILPPDRVLAFVVQLTEGCPWNRCSFCGLYPDRSFRARDPEELERHVRGALRLFGRSILLRRSIFLGDGDPFVLSDAKLLPRIDRVLEIVREESARGAALPSPGDLYAFARVRSLARRLSFGLDPFRARGFRRIYLGVETGDPELFRLLRKPGSLEELPGAVRALKESGIAAGLIFLVGVGGARFRETHREGTARLVSSLPLDANDILYLSPFRLVEGSTYAGWAAAEGIEAPARAEIAADAHLLAERIRAAGSPAKTAYYPLEHFVY
ncbi:MAG: radical SAM protein [Candidatus Eisenbacteria bacterium]|nr:radical SAM protein [Candidatus Eisenbacteria bacterium]